jgi:hypothetical protein
MLTTQTGDCRRSAGSAKKLGSGRDEQESRSGGVLARDDRGNVIGRVIAPVGKTLFGRDRGSVYLAREH